MINKKYRDSSSFGKRMEYNIIGELLTEGLDVYTPLVDDHGVDAIIKKDDGTFIELQIKARSNDDKNIVLSRGSIKKKDMSKYLIENRINEIMKKFK